jgi:hypothetical protein
MVIQKNLEFLRSMSTPTVSKAFPNATGDILSVQISGAFTGTVHIEGRNNSQGDWVSLAGISLTDFAVARNGFKSAGMYEIGIVGVRELRARIDEAQGDVKIFGQIISTEET